MNAPIEAILFDVGGTLRGSWKKPESEQVEFVKSIGQLLGASESPHDLLKLLNERTAAYLSWSRRTHIELDEVGQWTRWLLPDWPEDQIREQALALNKLWRQTTGERIMFPETREVVQELFNRGYRLGVVSNTVSSTEVPDLLDEQGISGCFEVIILSCLVGIRKPDPSILLEATKRMVIEPENCAYIGNKLDRDVDSSRKAGFSKSIILLDSEDGEQYTTNPAAAPQHYISNLVDLLDIFPALSNQPAAAVVYNASLSTMWANKFPSLVEFSEASRRLGFRKIELNHQVDSAMLSGIKFNQQQISSIHEPCPSDVSAGELKERDWLISATEEDSRKKGVEAIKRSIDLAGILGVKSIIVHAGTVSADLSMEIMLRVLFESGMVHSPEYQKIKMAMIEERARLAGPHLEAVQMSLIELLEHSTHLGVRLGLENRYHYYDIPSLDEMGQFLSLAGPDRLGFIYDVGHAQTLDRLGFFSYEEWLRRFCSRIIGVHIHDVQGVTDHQAPGLGEVDFKMIAPYLPPDAFRTIEVHPGNSTEQLKNGLRFLEEQGCIVRN
jgi:FMN phosphatase YigB (HAD superfamily)/sugar phosphate isomerase/epimerase